MAGFPETTVEVEALGVRVTALEAGTAASVAVKRGRLILEAELASGSELDLGESYVVGSNRLMLFFDNVLLEPGETEQYVEVGTAGDTSQTVQTNFTMPADGLVTYVIFV